MYQRVRIDSYTHEVQIAAPCSLLPAPCSLFQELILVLSDPSRSVAWLGAVG
ncbi:hypothetical protein [Moorena bouillonii]|uniref:hypothetical protein n=1 Tax=Moorena bouillonii TaxID=207920 RepID=UPI001300E01A|nr:hypothetical protein [Moorena bouillonii]